MLDHTGFHDERHYSPDCPKCEQRVTDNIIGIHLSHCYQGENENNCKYGDDENCPARKEVASLTPKWLIAYEEEQDNKMAILEKQVRQLKESDFAEMAYSSEFRRVQLDGGQFVYEKVLRLIRKMEGEK